MIALAIITTLSSISFLYPGSALINSSATSEWELWLSPHSVGIVHSRSSMPDVLEMMRQIGWPVMVDPKSVRILSSYGAPWIGIGRSVEYQLNNGAQVQASAYFVSYVPFAFISLLVIFFECAERVRGPLSRFWERRRLRRLQRRGLRLGEVCPVCEYDLRASKERCPECGQAFVRQTIIIPLNTAAQQDQVSVGMLNAALK